MKLDPVKLDPVFNFSLCPNNRIHNHIGVRFSTYCKLCISVLDMCFTTFTSFLYKAPVHWKLKIPAAACMKASWELALHLLSEGPASQFLSPVMLKSLVYFAWREGGDTFVRFFLFFPFFCCWWLLVPCCCCCCCLWRWVIIEYQRVALLCQVFHTVAYIYIYLHICTFVTGHRIYTTDININIRTFIYVYDLYIIYNHLYLHTVWYPILTWKDKEWHKE